ncbi:MAG TPA: hypothetical protein VF278_18180 [Pirellulales bacterium]
MSHSLNDPHLQALEARLANMPPQVSMTRRQQLLYECAFAAGRKSAGRIVRRWQAAAVVLIMALVGLRVSPAGNAPIAAERGGAALTHREVSPESADGALELSPLGRRPSREVSLDAWQVRSRAAASFERGPAELAHNDPRLRALTVGALTRRILEE